MPPALRALVINVSCTLRALVTHVPRTLHTLVLYMLPYLTWLFPYVSSCLPYFLSYVPSFLMCLVHYVFSCPLCASYLACSHISSGLCFASSCTSRASYPVCSRAFHASCLICVVPCVHSCFMSPFPLSTPIASYLNYSTANIIFCVLEFPCFKVLFFLSFPSCNFFGKFTQVVYLYMYIYISTTIWSIWPSHTCLVV